MRRLPELVRRPACATEAVFDSIALRNAICDSTLQECTEAFGDQLKAIISTGSLARDEASFLRQENSFVVCGDAEFLVVFKKNVAVPPTATLSEIRRRVERNLLQEKIQCKIDLSAVHPSYFQRLPAHIFTYELKHCGQVIWGDEEILQLIPDWPVDDLSLQDAWQLLCNRMIEMLECAAELTNDENPPSATLHYKIVKLYLDMATSFLIFVRAYAPTYKERQKNLRRLADEKLPSEEFPFDLGIFANFVTASTAQKLAPDSNGERLADFSARAAIQAAYVLWRWELVWMAGANGLESDRELFTKWMRKQPLVRRARGWIYTLRASGWHKSYRQWLHWLRLASKASPRYWIYFVASSVLFRLKTDENPSSEDEQQADRMQLASFLPVRKKPAKGQELSWERLASDVVWNYRTFLMGTRS